MSELHDSLIVLYRSFNRKIPPDLKNQEKLLLSLINYSIAKFQVAEENGKIIGLGALFLFGDICSLGYMAVLPEVRRKGLGTSIFSKLVEIGRMKGCKTFMLYASESGAPIYHKFGFRSKYATNLYSLPKRPSPLQETNIKVNCTNIFPYWAALIDRNAMGFDRSEFLQLKINHGSILITIDKEGFALLSGSRLGPVISKNIDTAVYLINEGIKLGASNIIVPKHSHFPIKIFDFFNLTERDSESNIKMVYGKEVTQILNHLYALGTYAKG
ncbi:MAG: GNAT family N-acetyltransferase [Candidatus Lokiarchaeota archaeon]|nr:GNAT family N-acetyltransferase [Candidatus Lokiarchaeota archaeon]